MRNPCHLAAAAAALLLSACEKPAGPVGAPAPQVAVPPSATPSAPMVGSALPTQPSLADPVFGPEFVDRAGGSNLFGIAEAKLALTRSKSADVKAFASDMIAAHTKSNAALQAAVDASGQTTDLPTVLPDDLQVRYAALAEAAASGFDKAYLADQVAAHQDALDALRIYARRGDTPALKQFAAAATPIVEDHLARAKALQGPPS